MNILILNGNPSVENAEFDRYIEGYRLKLHKTAHYVKAFLLRDLRLNGVDGISTEGPTEECRFYQDDLRYIVNSLQEADLIVWASPLRQGAGSNLTRMVQQRVYRYLQNSRASVAGYMTDLQSHPRIPLIGAILQPESTTTSQEILLNKLTQERLAAELQTVLSFLITTTSDLADALGVTFRSFDYRLYIEDTCNDLVSGAVTERKVI